MPGDRIDHCRRVTRTVAIVGSGIGGVRTAQALRSLGYDGRLVLVGRESELPYDRPPLSKEFLSGRRDTAALSLLSDQDATDARISLRLGVAAVRIAPGDRRIELGDGEVLPYDVCVVATGSSPRLSPWNKLPGVHLLRSLADSRALREELLRRRQLAVIGGGFIGAEVAATARALGARVTIIDPLPLPMHTALGTRVAQMLVGLQNRNGVTTKFGVGVNSVNHNGHHIELELSDGSALTADAVVVGIGATPNDAWLAGSGLPVDNGLICDSYCRVEGTNDVFAVGDVARWRSPALDRHIRVEHWTNAVDQARCVAHNIMFPNQPAEYDGVEYVWTDQYDWKVQVAGHPASGSAGAEIIVGDLDSQRPRGAVLFPDRKGTLCGAVTVNWPRAIAQCRHALSTGGSYQYALDRIARTRR